MSPVSVCLRTALVLAVGACAAVASAQSSLRSFSCDPPSRHAKDAPECSDWSEQRGGSWLQFTVSGPTTRYGLLEKYFTYEGLEGMLVESEQEDLIVFLPRRPAAGDKVVAWKMADYLDRGGAPFLLGVIRAENTASTAAPVGNPGISQADRAQGSSTSAQGISLDTLRVEASKGNVAAQSQLGYRLLTSRGGAQDTEQGLQMLKRAATAGYPQAQYALGLVYYSGVGGRANLEAARLWMSKAAAQNYPKAVNVLDVIDKRARNSASAHLSAANTTKAAIRTSASTALTQYVAYSFSSPGLAGFGGDGAWGASIQGNQQNAIEGSAQSCVSKSSAPDNCGTGNGGSWKVCQADGNSRWAALAIANDGTAENWSDGESISAVSEADARQNALADCGGGACRVVWSQPVNCGNEKPATACRGSNSLDWVNRMHGRQGETLTLTISATELTSHQYQPAAGATSQIDTTVELSQIGQVDLKPAGNEWAVLVYPTPPQSFHEHALFNGALNYDGAGSLPILFFASQTDAQQAADYFNYQRCGRH